MISTSSPLFLFPFFLSFIPTTTFCSHITSTKERERETEEERKWQRERENEGIGSWWVGDGTMMMVMVVSLSESTSIQLRRPSSLSLFLPLSLLPLYPLERRMNEIKRMLFFLSLTQSHKSSLSVFSIFFLSLFFSLSLRYLFKKASSRRRRRGRRNCIQLIHSGK